MQTTDQMTEWLDKLAIREVLEAFLRHMDDGAVDRLVALFDEDGVFGMWGSDRIGRDDIAGYFRPEPKDDPLPWYTPGEEGRQPHVVHLCGNPLVELEGDRAKAESDFVVFHASGPGTFAPAFAGRFRDHLRKDENGRWLITSRGLVTIAPEDTGG